MKFVTLSLVGFVFAAAITSGAWAEPVGPDLAKATAEQWIRTAPARLKRHPTRKIAKLREIGLGNQIVHAAELETEGYLIIAGDDTLPPVLAFSETGRLGDDKDNPLIEILAERMARYAEYLSNNKLRAQQKAPGWSGAAETLNGTTAVDDIRVSPLIASTWGQQETPMAFNYYTPKHYPCGCVATAMAQVMFYFHWPTTPVGRFQNTIFVDEIPQTGVARGGDGMGGPYNWDLMVNSAVGASTASCQAMGALTSDAGISVSMQYSADESGAYSEDVPFALMGNFNYRQASLTYPGSRVATALNGNLDANLPVILAISGTSGGHAVVCDGYGYYSGVIYHHLNMGWHGHDDLWYNLPDIKTTSYVFTSVKCIIYNILTDSTGETISGRTLSTNGFPIPGATVTITCPTGRWTATSRQNGVWGVSGIPSSTLFSVTASAPLYDSKNVTAQTGLSSDYSIGTVSGLDIKMSLSPEPPKIIQRPISQTVMLGSNVTFYVQALSDSPLAYQWQFNGANIPKSILNSYSIDHVTAQNAGDYRVIVTAGNVSSTSSVATLTVLLPPSITSQPQTLSVLQGSQAQLSVTAAGTAPLHFQWLVNGTPTGRDSSILTISNVLAQHAGRYNVVVSNDYGSVTSDVAVLTVALPPSITKQPQSQSVVFGKPVVFSALATGDGILLYQWVFNGSEISGATSSEYRIESANLSTLAGNYWVIVRGDYGSIASSVARLTILYPPTFVLEPSSQSVGVGSNVTMSALATGDAPLRYQWYVSGEPIAGAVSTNYTITGVSPAHSANYTVVVTNDYGAITSRVAVFTAATKPAINFQPSNQIGIVGSQFTFSVDASGSPLEYQWFFNGALIPGANAAAYSAPIKASCAGAYFVVITNAAGSATSSTAVLTALIPPYIITQPQNQQVGTGTNVTFSVAVGGDAPLFNQWFFNNAAIAGATNNSYSILGAVPADRGRYALVVSNSYGAITSRIAFLEVVQPPKLISSPSACTNLVGTSASFQVSADGSIPLTFQWLRNGVAISGATSSTYSITNLSFANAGNYSVVITNFAGSVTSSPALLTIPEPPSIATQPAVNQTVRAGSNAVLSVSATGFTPLSFQWQLTGTNIPGATSSNYNILCAAARDAGFYRVVVTNIAGAVTSRQARLMVGFPPSITSQPQSRTNVVGTAADFSVGVSGTASFQWRFNGADIPGAVANPFTIPSVAASNSGAYSVVITNTYGAVTSSIATLTVLTPPRIFSQPVSQSVGAGSNASFAIQAAGDAPLSYQWRLNGTNIPSATSSNYVISGVCLSHAGDYSVVVQNTYGSATSSLATLTVLIPPTFTSQPRGITNISGACAEFSFAATGTDPLTYQWRRNGTNLIGVTSTNYSIPAISAADVGGYSVVVTNVAGCATSQIAVLTITTAPAIIAQPTDQAVAVGSNAVLEVKAVGVGPLFYQWQKNNVKLAASTRVSGVTSNVLTIQKAAKTDAGAYTVIVTNALGKVVSSAAALNVYTPDSTKPTLVVSSPAKNQQIMSNLNVFVASGTAKDNCAVSNVLIQLNSNEWIKASSSNRCTNWTAVIALSPGTNILRACAVDTTGNRSATTTVACVYYPLARLCVLTNSSGSVSPFTNGQFLIIGSNYTATAKPAAGWIFSNWSGTISGTANPLVFTMATNTVLQPIFIRNPFSAIAGVYQGLFIDNSNSFSVSGSGYFTARIGDSGTFTASLSITNKNWPFSGQFSPAGTATSSVAFGSSNAAITLRLDFLEQLTGVVSNRGWTAQVLAKRAAFSTTNPAPWAGVYTMVIPGTDGVPIQPGGDGFATVMVDSSGNVTFGGILADGAEAALTQSSALSKQGQWPLYIPLYSGMGSIYGWITFTNEPDNDLNGRLTWIKPAKAKGGAAYYSSGFTNTTEALGSRYSATSKPILNTTNAQLILSEGNLAQPLANRFVLTTSNAVSSANKSLVIKFTPASGQFTGSVSNSWPSTKKLLFKGVVFQKQTNAYGYYLGTNKTGEAVIKP